MSVRGRDYERGPSTQSPIGSAVLLGSGLFRVGVDMRVLVGALVRTFLPILRVGSVE